MNYLLENEKLKVEIADLGAELQSIKSKKTGFEYLWQGKEPFWKSRSTVLFPICGRLQEGKYTFGGKTYEMTLHGFAKRSIFDVEYKSDEKAIFTLKANEESKKTYPFEFTFKVTYALNGDKLVVTYTVENGSEEVLPFSVGGHPGFNVPILNKGEFTDYYIEFAEKCEPERLILSQPAYLYSGKHSAFKLEDGRRIRLRHELFDDDAIFLRNTSKKVSLKSDKIKGGVSMTFGDFNYIGFWHNPKTEAPFVCFEPWHGAPGTDGKVEDFTEKYLMIQLKKGETYSTWFDIEIEE